MNRLRILLVAAVIGGVAAVSVPQQVEACYICNGCFEGMTCCTGNYNGFDNCAQQGWGCATYGEWCTWIEQQDLAPDGGLMATARPESFGAVGLSFEATELQPGLVTVRQSCNGAIVERRYGEDIQLEKGALSQSLRL